MIERTEVAVKFCGQIIVCFLLIIIAACRQPAPTAAPQTKSERLTHPIFNEAFTDGFAISQNGIHYKFHPQYIGDMRITSGKLIACDPLVDCNGEFLKTVPVGSFPLYLAIAHIGEDERIGLTKIVFAAGKIDSWELALTEGQNVSLLKKGEIFGYGVDSGTGAFMDLAALQIYQEQRNREGESFDQRLFAELDKTYRHTRSWHLFQTEKGTVAIFSTGYGDGVYPSYRGYDKAGNLLAIITDFGLIEWE